MRKKMLIKLHMQTRALVVLWEGMESEPGRNKKKGIKTTAENVITKFVNARVEFSMVPVRFPLPTKCAERTT